MSETCFRRKISQFVARLTYTRSAATVSLTTNRSVPPTSICPTDVEPSPSRLSNISLFLSPSAIPNSTRFFHRIAREISGPLLLQLPCVTIDCVFYSRKNMKTIQFVKIWTNGWLIIFLSTLYGLQLYLVLLFDDRTGRDSRERILI